MTNEQNNKSRSVSARERTLEGMNILKQGGMNMSDIDWSILKNPNSNVWSQYVDRDEQNAIRGLIAEVERLRVQLNGLGGENELLKKQLRIERGAEAEVERLRGTLQQVLDYRHGQGKYDLSHITNPHEKANAAHDMWYEIEADIRAALTKETP